MAQVTKALADNAVTSAKILDGTIAATDLASSTGNFGAWTTYTPTWAGSVLNPTVGDAVFSAAYSQIGKRVKFRIVLTMGATTAFGTGFYTFTLPVTAAAGAAGSYTPIGSIVILDFSSSLIYEATAICANTTVVLGRYQTGGLLGANAPISPLGTSDVIAINGTYEAA